MAMCSVDVLHWIFTEKCRLLSQLSSILAWTKPREYEPRLWKSPLRAHWFSNCEREGIMLNPLSNLSKEILSSTTYWKYSVAWWTSIDGCGLERNPTTFFCCSVDYIDLFLAIWANEWTALPILELHHVTKTNWGWKNIWYQIRGGPTRSKWVRGYPRAHFEREGPPLLN